MAKKRTITDLRKFLAKARREVEAALPSIVRDFAHSAKVISERNIIEKGFGETYSSTEVPAFYFYGKEINQKGKSEREKRSKKKETMSWAQFRSAQGLPDDHVTLSYSNEMWRGTNVVGAEKIGNVYYSILGSTTESGRNKLQWNFERYGNFMLKGLSKKDEAFLVNDVAIEPILEIIKKNLD